MRGLCHHSNDGDFLEGGGESFWNPIKGWWPTGCDALGGPAIGNVPCQSEACLHHGGSTRWGGGQPPTSAAFTWYHADQSNALTAGSWYDVDAWGHPFVYSYYNYYKDWWSHFGGDYNNPQGGEPTGCRKFAIVRHGKGTFGGGIGGCVDTAGGGRDCTMPIEVEIRLTAIPNYPLGIGSRNDPETSSFGEHNCMPNRGDLPHENIGASHVSVFHPAVGDPVPFSFCDAFDEGWGAVLGQSFRRGTGGENGVGFITLPKTSDDRSAEEVFFAIRIPDPPCVFVYEVIDRNYRYSPGIENGVPVRGWPELYYDHSGSEGETYGEYHAGYIGAGGATVGQTAYTSCYHNISQIFQRFDVEYSDDGDSGTGQWCDPGDPGDSGRWHGRMHRGGHFPLCRPKCRPRPPPLPWGLHPTLFQT